MTMLIVSTLLPSSSSRGGDLGEAFPGQIDHRVEHVRAGVEQEAAAGHRRTLRHVPRCWDRSFCQTVALMLSNGPSSPPGSSPRRSALGDRPPWKATTSRRPFVVDLDQMGRFQRIHHHRLLQQHVDPASTQATVWL